MIDLSLNEVETVAAKAARGAGLSWGGAEEIGKAARAMARAGMAWDEALLAAIGDEAVAATPGFELVVLDRFAPMDLAPGATARSRFLIAPDRLAALEAWAARTYVPASARSRAAGAGAGLTDND